MHEQGWSGTYGSQDLPHKGSCRACLGSLALIGVADQSAGFGVADSLAAAEVRVLELVTVGHQPPVAGNEVRADDDAGPHVLSEIATKPSCEQIDS